GNLVYFNNFSGNGLHAYDDGLYNRWDNGSHGNYWDNYTGSDEDENGIGDTPYNITGSALNKDHYPIIFIDKQPPSKYYFVWYFL
ncbi:unnamed protein product, partial [marine sediment metagenome]